MRQVGIRETIPSQPTEKTLTLNDILERGHFIKVRPVEDGQREAKIVGGQVGHRSGPILGISRDIDVSRALEGAIDDFVQRDQSQGSAVPEQPIAAPEREVGDAPGHMLDSLAAVQGFNAFKALEGGEVIVQTSYDGGFRAKGDFRNGLEPLTGRGPTFEEAATMLCSMLVKADK